MRAVPLPRPAHPRPSPPPPLQLFDFDTAAAPILEALCGGALDRARIELAREAELEARAAARALFETVRGAEGVECERLRMDLDRRHAEKARRRRDEDARTRERKYRAAVVDARALARQQVDTMLTDGFEDLEEEGVYADPVTEEIAAEFLPWLFSEMVPPRVAVLSEGIAVVNALGAAAMERAHATHDLCARLHAEHEAKCTADATLGAESDARALAADAVAAYLAAPPGEEPGAPERAPTVDDYLVSAKLVAPPGEPAAEEPAPAAEGDDGDAPPADAVTLAADAAALETAHRFFEADKEHSVAQHSFETVADGPLALGREEYAAVPSNVEAWPTPGPWRRLTGEVVQAGVREYYGGAVWEMAERRVAMGKEDVNVAGGEEGGAEAV